MSSEQSLGRDDEQVKRKKNKLAKTWATRTEPDQQILTFVTPRLDDEKWSALSTYLHTVLTSAIQDRAELDGSLIIWNDLYEGKVPETKDSPWPDASNLHVPLTQEMLDGLHGHLSKASLGVDPIVLVKGEDALGVEVEAKLQQYYNSISVAIDLPEIMSQSIFLALRDGVALLKITWERRTRKVKTRKMVPMKDEMGQPIMDPDTMVPLREESVEIDDVVEYNNVRVLPVELKDFYLLPSHAYGLERYYAKGGAERVWMRWDQIYTRAKSGEYRMSEAMKLKDAVPSRSQTSSSTANLDVDTISGQVQISSTPGFEEFEVFDIYMSYDLDGDGYEEECWFTYVPIFNVLLRAEVFPYWHQLRPYVAVIPWPRPRRFYGFSVPQRLESINRELNAIHNQRIDAVSLRLSPPMVITRSALLRGDASQPWGPGARLEVNNSEDVQLPSLPDINPSSFSEENILRQYAERVVGRYDVNTPRGTGSRRTRAEIGAIQGESMVRFDYMMKLIQRAVVKTFEQMHQLKIQYMAEEGERFEAVGMDGVEKYEIKRSELLANIKFVANGDLPVADKERNKQEAYFLYGALMQNPLVAPRPDRVYSVTRILLEAWERKDIEKIIGTVDEVKAQMQTSPIPQGGPASGQNQQARPQSMGAGPRKPGAVRGL